MTKQTPGKKHLTIVLPEQMHEDFFGMFPGLGERSIFLREVIAISISLGKRAKLAQRVAEITSERRRKDEDNQKD